MGAADVRTSAKVDNVAELGAGYRDGWLALGSDAVGFDRLGAAADLRDHVRFRCSPRARRPERQPAR
ncbi:MAG TPA: hypothetical protein VF657_09590 [Actinoplanes sp.]